MYAIAQGSLHVYIIPIFARVHHTSCSNSICLPLTPSGTHIPSPPIVNLISNPKRTELECVPPLLHKLELQRVGIFFKIVAICSGTDLTRLAFVTLAASDSASIEFVINSIPTVKSSSKRFNSKC